jgi:predicted PurR-regulated permease PerM
MSLFYGLAAGLFVSVSTWAAMTYISHMAGICLGLFLVTFFVVSAVYLTGDDLVERQRTLLKALTNTEVVFFERLKDLDNKMNRLAALAQGRRASEPVSDHVQALDTLLITLDGILSATDTSSAPQAIRQE